MTARHDLFVVDPNDFVALRDELALELRTGGDKAGAAEIKKLRRPAIAVWALNRVATDRADLVGDMIDAADHAREVQRAMLEGADADDFRAALADRRTAIAAVTAAATTVIRGSGRVPDTYARDVENALHVVVASAELGAALRRSELPGLTTDTADLAELFADVQLPTGSPKRGPTPQAEPAPAPEERKRRERRVPKPAGPSPALLQARDEAERLGGELSVANQVVEDADATVAGAEAAAEAARRRVEEAVTGRDRARARRDVAEARLAESRARVMELESP